MSYSPFRVTMDEIYGSLQNRTKITIAVNDSETLLEGKVVAIGRDGNGNTWVRLDWMKDRVVFPLIETQESRVAC